MNEPPIDVEKGHRWFAVEWNNAAWDALEADGLDEAQKLAALHEGHGSVAHWRQVGNEVNWVRGLCLLVNVEASFGSSTSALRISELCEAKSTEVNGLADWDIAFIADASARAAAAAWDDEQRRDQPDAHRVEGLKVLAQQRWQRAHEFGEAIADEEDRKFFQQWHRRGAEHRAFS